MSLRYRDRQGACSVPGVAEARLGRGEDEGGGCFPVLFICCLMMPGCDGQCINMEMRPLCVDGGSGELVEAGAAEAASASAAGVVERMDTVEQAAPHTHLMTAPHPYRDHV